ncbi:MAG: peroxiredoxin [Methylomicrobium sp.]|nr:peroxiredoxin [Methylomicrobium sp.]
MTIAIPGEIVPSFEGAATGNTTIKSADLLGKNVVLYFYPKDNTPGCTMEGQAFRDRISDFEKLNTVILGVSRDSVKMHEGFKCKQAFPFELISDPDETLCNLFDVIKMKSMYGKQVRGIERSTFLLDKEGRLVREWRKVKVKGHVEEVLDAVTQLKA